MILVCWFAINTTNSNPIFGVKLDIRKDIRKAIVDYIKPSIRITIQIAEDFGVSTFRHRNSAVPTP